MPPSTFIFFGPSGSGKGEQAGLVMEFLKSRDPERKIIYIESGKELRRLAGVDSYTGKETKNILEAGGLTPIFLPVYLWSGILIDNVSGNEHIVMDGIARKPQEAGVLDSALQFYKRQNPIVVSLEVSDECAMQRLLGRGRSDDDPEEIKNRLQWYREEVTESIDYFKNSPYYRFLAINGERSIEEVHQDILEKSGLAETVLVG